MSKKRKQYNAEFEAKIALAVMRETETVPEFAARHQLHPTQINQWKRQALDNMAELFQRGKAKQEAQENVDDLHRVIGQLTVERDFLVRKLDH